MGFPDPALPDDELVRLAQAGDRRAERGLFVRHASLVRLRCRPYVGLGADHDDLVQEGLIGLHRAIRDYQAGCGRGFLPYAAAVVARAVLAAVRAVARAEPPVALAGPAARRARDPHELLVERDGLAGRAATLCSQLSGFEQRVLALYLRGVSYREIARLLQTAPKAVDNALARIKEKGRSLTAA